MDEKLISSVAIQKLGHDLLEIRQRALYTIISKLDRGFEFDNNLARSKEILTKLLEWFLYDPCTDEEAVFGLMRRILESESGAILIRHYGSSEIKREIDKLRSYTEPRFHVHIDELIMIVDEQTEKSGLSRPKVVVPPLESELPLSYRTGQSETSFIKSDKTVESLKCGTTATPIEGFVEQVPSVTQQAGAAISSAPSKCNMREESSEDMMDNRDQFPQNCLRNLILNWQYLIEADRHVLQSVETTFKNPHLPSALLDSCAFFKDVLLHDFPAEVFLQRPSSVIYFQNFLVTCPSTRITNSILECLLELTIALQIRIKLLNDPSIYNTKSIDLSAATSYMSSPVSKSSEGTASTKSSGQQEPEKIEDIVLLKSKQMTTVHFVFSTMRYVFSYLCVKSKGLTESTRRNVNQNGVNIALPLLCELLNLLKLCMSSTLWESKQNSDTREVIKQFSEMLVEYGDLLDYFRIESTSNDSDLNYRAIYLFLCCYTSILLKNTVPVSKSVIVLPKNLKTVLSHCIIDVTLARLYTRTHKILLEYAQNCCIGESSNLLKKYKQVDDICQSMSAASKLLKNYKTLKTCEILCLAKQSLLSLEFYKNLKMVRIFVDVCANKLPLYKEEDMWELAEDVTLFLLSHNLQEISEEMYRLCQRKVIAAIGPKLNFSGSGAPGSQVMFLLTPKILTEISLFGITSENIQVQKFSDDILVHILKCKILVSDEVWNKVIVALLPSMPALLCHCNKTSSLGRTLLDLLDPDIAHSNLLPSLTVLKCNIELLYCKDQSIRAEAYSRLCWLLSSQEGSKDFLPRLNNLNDRALSNVCQLTKILDVNRSRNIQHFYQPSNLEQVLEVLKSPNVEPVIRRSALTQISVMMEDPVLHQTFLDNSGFDIVTDIMKSALLEKDFKDYPDSIIPVISILKNLSLYHSGSRHELSVREEVLFFILRGLFMFFTEERVRQDASALLFLLIFNDFCMGTPSTGTFSLPKLVVENLNIPFKCREHWSNSQYKEESLISSVTLDKLCLSAIQIHWNLEMAGSFKELLEQNTTSPDLVQGDTLLHLSENDLRALKASSSDYCVEHYLIDIQNATSPQSVTEVIRKLTVYIHLYNVLSINDTLHDMSEHPWESSFSRFFKLLPSSEDDVKILTTLIQFLISLVNSYSTTDKYSWLNAVLKDPCFCLLDIIHVNASTSEESKSLSRKLLKLITICARKEQHYLDYYPNVPSENKANHQWFTVIQNIAESLKFSDAQHFYNLAYLDSLLLCLVNLTAMLGWSSSRQDTGPKQLIKQMISGLCELVNAFHYGKGPTAAVSVMGLSITRNSLLILNHLLAELQHFNVKGWEQCFLPELNDCNVLQPLISLLSSRDVVLRAAAMQLFSGLIVSPRLAVYIVGEIFVNKHNIWELAFSILVDQDEACIVKENAAAFLANLSSHTTRSADRYVLINGVDPSKFRKESISGKSLWDYIEEYQFFGSLELIMTCLFTNSKDWLSSNNTNKNGLRRFSNSEKSWSSSSSSKAVLISTPGLVKSVVLLVSHFLVLDYDKMVYNLHENGLIKLPMKCLCNPNMTVGNTKDLSLYCDIMEMNASICGLLAQIVVRSNICLGTVLHTRDCLNVMISLLNPKIFDTRLPQLVYLRNKLWSQIFHLVGTLIECGTDSDGRISQHSLEALAIFLDVLFETGKEAFLETLCEAIGSTGSNDLQTSALSSLTSLLKVESNTKLDEEDQEKQAFDKASMQNLLDNVKTPRTVCSDQMIDENEDNVKPNIPPKKKLSQKSLRHLHKINLLEDAYFSEILKKKVHNKPMQEKKDTEYSDTGEMRMAGAEICKILLNLFDLCNINMADNNMFGRKRDMVVAALTNVLSISQEAKNYALNNGLLHLIIEQLKDYHIKFSLESAECLRRVGDRKRVFPMLRELIDLIGLLTNFMIHAENVKCEASYLGLADFIHKLWVWFSAQRIYLADALRLLSTYTADCETACRSLLLTSAVAGAGPRKTPTNVSLLHVVINLVIKEMDQISKSHELIILQLCFDVLHNSCMVQDCRIVIMKSAILQSSLRLHPAITKKQKPWDIVEHLWLDFLQTYTFHPEGQTSVAKIPDVMDVIMSLATSGKETTKYSALLVLRNIAFHQPNRPRLLVSGEFLNILQTKLMNGTVDEKNTVVLIIWALAENNHKAKLVIKSAKLDMKLQDALKQLQLFPDGSHHRDVIERMHYVLSMLRESDKSR